MTEAALGQHKGMGCQCRLAEYREIQKRENKSDDRVWMEAGRGESGPLLLRSGTTEGERFGKERSVSFGHSASFWAVDFQMNTLLSDLQSEF